jgi:hypothetical protein
MTESRQGPTMRKSRYLSLLFLSLLLSQIRGETICYMNWLHSENICYLMHKICSNKRARKKLLLKHYRISHKHTKCCIFRPYYINNKGIFKSHRFFSFCVALDHISFRNKILFEFFYGVNFGDNLLKSYFIDKT